MKKEIIEKYLRDGDLITHTRCMGLLEEHYYTGKDGIWYCGVPTSETISVSKNMYQADDIHWENITHINRCPIDTIEIAIGFKDRR